MSVIPTTLRRQNSAGLNEIVGAKTVAIDDADTYFGKRGYGWHEMNADYLSPVLGGGVSGKCKVTGSSISSTVTGVTLVDNDPIFAGHKSVQFDGSVGSGLHYDKLDAVPSFTRLFICSLDPEMYAPTLTTLKFLCGVYGLTSDVYNQKLQIRNVSGTSRLQFLTGASLNSYNTKALSATGKSQLLGVSYNNATRTSRVFINDPAAYSEVTTHTALVSPAPSDDAWMIAGGKADNTNSVFKGRATNDIIIDKAMFTTPEDWALLGEHCAFLRPRYGIV